MFEINNRRYIGSKNKLVNIIYEKVSERINGKFVFADLFAGTGVVSFKFAKEGHKVIINDLLYSNYIFYNAWFSEEKIDIKKMNAMLNFFNSIKSEDLTDNYFSKIYSNKYFSNNDAKKIGYIREYIENLKNELNFREYCYLITSLIYSVDKIANTVGHYESFLKIQPDDKNFILKNLKLYDFKKCEIYNQDANKIADKIKADVFYIDPPYNARQYINFYHVIENLAKWDKPTEFEGNSMKFKRSHLKSDYSKAKAKDVFKDLIKKIECKYIVVSYNNTYSAKSSASNNKISEKDLLEVLGNRGNVETIELDHKYFNSGKTSFKNHKEKIYICEIF